MSLSFLFFLAAICERDEGETSNSDEFFIHVFFAHHMPSGMYGSVRETAGLLLFDFPERLTDYVLKCMELRNILP